MKYYPNYRYSDLVAKIVSPKPEQDDLRDDTFSIQDLSDVRIASLNGIGSSVCCVYVVYQKNNKWVHGGSATWWPALLPNGTMIGVTCLHVLESDVDIKNQILLIPRQQRHLDYMAQFTNTRVSILSKGGGLTFVPVDIKFDLMTKREDWLKEHAGDVEAIQKCCLDPEFHLMTHPVVDILFTEIPEVENLKPIPLSFECPKQNELIYQFGFNCTIEHESTELDDMYAETPRPLDPKALLHDDLSISLGCVQVPGDITNVLSTLEVGSSGGPALNSDFKAYGTGCGGYYDQAPSDPAEETKLSTYYDLEDSEYEEKGLASEKVPRNRNITLSFHHPCVLNMLEEIELDIKFNHTNEECKEHEQKEAPNENKKRKGEELQKEGSKKQKESEESL